MQALSLGRHCSIAFSTTLCFVTGKALLQIICVLNRCLIEAFFYQRPDPIVNWIEVWWIRWPDMVQWSLGFHVVAARWCPVTVCRCAVLLEYEDVPWHTPNIWQHLLLLSIWRVVRWVCGAFSWLSTRSCTVLMSMECALNVVIRCLACDINTVQVYYKILYSARRMPRKLTEQLVRSKEKLERIEEQWVE